jgi:hypothetical protein
MKAACCNAMHSCPCADDASPRRVGASCIRRFKAAAATLALFALPGCVLPVPVPGVKSGRAVDETSPAEIAPGTPFADVLLRLGEPDSVSPDGRQIAYRFSRLWGAVLWAVGGPYSAVGGVAPMQFGEAVVVTFDGEGRVVGAERRAGRWFDARPGDAALFQQPPGGQTLFLPDGDAVSRSWVATWWSTRVNPPRASAEPELNLPPAAMVSPNMLIGESGQALLGAHGLWLRPVCATGTAETNWTIIPFGAVRAVFAQDVASPVERLVFVLPSGQIHAVAPPHVAPGKERDWDALEEIRQFWRQSAATSTRPDAADRADRADVLEGWTVTVEINAPGQKRVRKPGLCCLWATNDGLRFEHFDPANRPVVVDRIPWGEIEAIEAPGAALLERMQARFQVVMRCRDGRRISLVSTMLGAEGIERMRDVLAARVGDATKAAPPVDTEASR